MGNDNKCHSGQHVIVRTPANVQAVREHFQQSPRKWTRLLSQEVGISSATVQRIVHTDLHLFPYKVLIFQKLTDANKRERVEFCHMISERTENKPGVLDLILFSDEDHFHINKQNMRCWAYIFYSSVPVCHVYSCQVVLYAMYILVKGAYMSCTF